MQLTVPEPQWLDVVAQKLVLVDMDEKVLGLKLKHIETDRSSVFLLLLVYHDPPHSRLFMGCLDVAVALTYKRFLSFIPILSADRFRYPCAPLLLR